MVYGQPFWPFKGQRPQERPKSFLACGSSSRAEVGWLQQPPSPSPSEVRALERVRTAVQCTQCSSPVLLQQEYSCSPDVMFSPLSLFTSILYAAVYFMQQSTFYSFSFG